MSFFYSDDPAADAERHYAEQDRQLDRFPKCTHCGYPIQSEKLYDLDGELYHLSCFAEQYQKDTEDYME